MSSRIYLDYNSTTPPHEALKAPWLDWWDVWGNPSSIHAEGRGPKNLLRNARFQLAQFFGVSPLELVFTSTGSEANNLAIKGSWLKRSHRYKIFVSPLEHPSLLRAARSLECQGAEVRVIPFSESGGLDLEFLRSQVDEKTLLVSVMFASNETGHVLPIKKVVEICKPLGILVHCDGVQALGKMSFSIPDLGVDLMSFSSHKFYSPRGAGALYVKSGTQLESLIHGGGQERGRRAGTENVLSLAAWGFVCELLKEDVSREYERILCQRRSLETEILNSIPESRIVGFAEKRLPNTTCLVIPSVDGETLMMSLDLKGVAVSTGAACSSGRSEPSPALLGMGLSRSEAQSTLRVSQGWPTTADDLGRFVSELKAQTSRLREVRREAAL